MVDWLEVPIYPHYYVEKYSRYYSSSYRDRVLNDVSFSPSAPPLLFTGLSLPTAQYI